MEEEKQQQQQQQQQSIAEKLSILLQHWSFPVFLVFSILPLLFLSSFFFGLGSQVSLVLTQTKNIDYKDALFKSIFYFESQRSGRLPTTQRVSWRHHSGLTDGLAQGVDLVGGYYDAGDNVKFGFPMAFTVTMLSWSVSEYSDQITAAGEYHHALEAIKWATDYFLKAHSQPNVLWAQVGDGSNDHECWQRPENMTTSRQAYKIDENHPGSDLAGETAAAMAAASILFNTTNPNYARTLLNHAKQLFEFADKVRGKYDDSLKIVKGYYPSSGYTDELLWAALWLYRATKNVYYLKYVTENAHDFGGTTWAMEEFTWDVKHAGVQVLASKLLMAEKPKEHIEIFQQYRSKAEHYVCACLNKNNATTVRHTPGGLLYVRKWNNMQHVANAAFLLSVYADQLQVSNHTVNCHGGSVGPDEILSFAKLQVEYILGSNPMGMSYLVGYGQSYPLRVHHRAASIEANKGYDECTEGYKKWYKSSEPNPNIIVGALVGGPNKEDQFNDERRNFEQTEACTYNTAPLVGVFAKLYALETST